MPPQKKKPEKTAARKKDGPKKQANRQVQIAETQATASGRKRIRHSEAKVTRNIKKENIRASARAGEIADDLELVALFGSTESRIGLLKEGIEREDTRFEVKPFPVCLNEGIRNILTRRKPLLIVVDLVEREEVDAGLVLVGEIGMISQLEDAAVIICSRFINPSDDGVKLRKRFLRLAPAAIVISTTDGYPSPRALLSHVRKAG